MNCKLKMIINYKYMIVYIFNRTGPIQYYVTYYQPTLETIPENKKKLKKYKSILINYVMSMYLDLSNKGLTAFPTIPLGVRVLNISHNNITEFPNILPSSLREINASYNKITEFPECINSMCISVLNLKYNQLKYIPRVLPHTLTKLIASYNNIQYITPATIACKLTYLQLSHNSIINLPDDLPDTIEYLNLNSNCINEFSVLPESLKTFKIACNRLVKLPAFTPDTLTIIDFSYNKLTKINNKFSHELEILLLSHNNITMFPSNLPEGIVELHMDYNEIQTIERQLIPNSLYILIINNNKLINEPEIDRNIPVSIIYANLSDNTGISCIMDQEEIIRNDSFYINVMENDNSNKEDLTAEWNCGMYI